jgi:hypothetical protein
MHSMIDAAGNGLGWAPLLAITDSFVCGRTPDIEAGLVEGSLVVIPAPLQVLNCIAISAAFLREKGGVQSYPQVPMKGLPLRAVASY